MELKKVSAKDLKEKFNACYAPVDSFGGEAEEKTIVEALDMEAPFENKLWTLYSGAFCGENFFCDLAIKIAHMYDIMALPFGHSILVECAEETDKEKRKKLHYQLVALAERKGHKEKEVIEFIKSEILKALNEGTLYI